MTEAEFNNLKPLDLIVFFEGSYDVYVGQDGNLDDYEVYGDDWTAYYTKEKLLVYYRLPSKLELILYG